MTEAGRAIALEVIRHHRLLETYLAQVLNIPWDRVHDETEKLKHVLSEYLEERIDELLGHPSVDPHGSPIPSYNGKIQVSPRLRLPDLSKGDYAEIVEVNDHDPKLLARLDELNLHPNTRLQVMDVEPIDRLIKIRVSGEIHTLGQNTTGQIFVRKLTVRDR